MSSNNQKQGCFWFITAHQFEPKMHKTPTKIEKHQKIFILRAHKYSTHLTLFDRKSIPNACLRSHAHDEKKGRKTNIPMVMWFLWQTSAQTSERLYMPIR